MNENLKPQNNPCKVRYLNQNIQNTFILKINSIIEKNITDENFGIPHLCYTIGLCRSQIHNKIKVETGLSTSIFIRNIRLKKASIFLRNSDLNISEIAYQVGFKDSNYFSKLYKIKYGLSPKNARKRFRKK